MTRVLSCIQPTGDVHLGNYLGALRNWVSGQHEHDAFHGIVDLHALTITETPGVIGESTVKLAAMLFAVGLDPDTATVFVQSHVVEHTQLCWIMECTVSYGELSRMIQFKEKSAKREGDFISAGLYTYPALQAADILLYNAEEVPVGDDQRQHVELTRDLAIRFNHSYGPVFVVPEVRTPAAGARVMDLQDPARKMSKSIQNDAGVIRLTDRPDVVRRKVARAVTDSDTGPDAVRSAADKPGVTNLLDILEACGGSADRITTYGALKSAVTEAVVATLEPLQKRYAELADDPAYVDSVFADGAARCREVTASVLADATAAMGL